VDYFAVAGTSWLRMQEYKGGRRQQATPGLYSLLTYAVASILTEPSRFDR
jgi:hypothetical protein